MFVFRFVVYVWLFDCLFGYLVLDLLCACLMFYLVWIGFELWFGLLLYVSFLSGLCFKLFAFFMVFFDCCVVLIACDFG